MPLTTPGEINEALRRFRRSQRGSAAIEFAIVAPLFFALLFATFELALMFFAGQVLERVTQDSARLIFTNQAQEQDWDADVFKTKLCENIRLPLFNCDGISVDVKVFSKFSVINPADLSDPIDSNGKLQTTNFSYSQPPPGSTVVVRAFYQWPLFVTPLGFNFANLVGENDSERFRLLTATAAFRVEPGSTAK